MFSGQPYPELDDGVALTRLPSLDLYREPDPFRTPRPSEFRDWIDVARVGDDVHRRIPRAADLQPAGRPAAAPPGGEFDVVHDNQSLGWGLLRLTRAGIPTVATVHHPVAIDRRARARRHPVAAPAADPAPLVRASPACRPAWPAGSTAVTTVSENSRRDIATHMGLPAGRRRGHPGRHRPRPSSPPRRPGGRRDPDSILVITSADVALKGLVHLLEALAKLRTERPVRLTVVGTARPGGPAEAALDRLALRDAVRFTGPVPEAELVDLLQRASVVAIPSLYEGFSLPADRGHGLRDAAGHHRRRGAARGGRRARRGCGSAPGTSAS